MNPPIKPPNMNEYILTLTYDTHHYNLDYIHNTIGYRTDLETLSNTKQTSFIFKYQAPNLEDALMGAMNDVLEALPSVVLLHVKTN